jgi:glycerol-3-phosphate acyltransferase PlsY
MDAALPLLIIIGSYLLGSVPTGVVLARLMGKQDIRTAGSGNIGATNATRLLGKKFGAFTFLGDMLKGFVPVLTAGFLLAGNNALQVQFTTAACGLAAFLGHLYPLYLRFKGGKGVATACGVMLALEPITIPFLLLIFIAVAAISRFVSLASLSSAFMLPMLLLAINALIHPVPLAVMTMGFMMAIFVFLKHGANIQRLLQGTENRIGSKQTAAPK